MIQYRIPDSVMAAHLTGEAVILNLDTKSYHRLNETASVVWKGIEQGKVREALIEDLCAKFEVDEATAGSELDRLLTELLERRLIVTGE